MDKPTRIDMMVDRFHRYFRHPGWQPMVTWTVIVEAEAEKDGARFEQRLAFYGFNYKPASEERRCENGWTTTLRWRCVKPVIRYGRIVPTSIPLEQIA